VEALGLNPAFWAEQRVLVTGHSGFKGAWLSFWLQALGARVTGFALPPETSPNLYDVLALQNRIDSHFADIRDADEIRRVFHRADPTVVFHLAAQPLVRRSYREPIETFSVNAMGTANVLEGSRSAGNLRAVVIVTTDKCYANEPSSLRAFREHDPLGGHDPYSASKACAELIAAAYRSSFLASRGVVVATARAGNVIGGGDWAEDRIIPDIVRAASAGRAIEVRNPHAVRPWQHVFEALYGYLLLAQRAAGGEHSLAEAWNFGPESSEALAVGEVVELFQNAFGSAGWRHVPEGADLYEAPALVLDASKARSELGWKPRLSITAAIELTAEWYRRYYDRSNIVQFSEAQLHTYAA
jgi:CDP-glucose 4,6-dehydratase